MPYQRDVGMSEREADELATAIAAVEAGQVSVERDGRFFAVTVITSRGSFTLRDEEDWRWLRSQMSERLLGKDK